MPMVIGGGSVTGLNVGGLPAGSVNTSILADSSITTAKILDSTIAAGDLGSSIINSSHLSSTGKATFSLAARTSAHSLNGDSGWVDHLSTTITCGVACRLWIIFTCGNTFESGAVTGFFRILVDGSKVGYNWCGGKQSTANAGGSGSGQWFADVAAGSHTIMVQARNSAGSTNWQTPYWSVDGEASNQLGVLYYA